MANISAKWWRCGLVRIRGAIRQFADKTCLESIIRRVVNGLLRLNIGPDKQIDGRTGVITLKRPTIYWQAFQFC